MNREIRRRAAFLLLLCAATAAPAAAQAPAPVSGRAEGEPPRPVAAASTRSGPVRVDGHVDEAAWAAAVPVTDFTQQRPDEGAPASERTEVRFLYDDEALYIGARMFDSQGAAGVTRRLVRRDQGPQADLLRIDFDTFRDRLSFVQFAVNPAGWRADAVGNDYSWDPVWEAATRVDSLGWTAEIRIPFSQLRFNRDSVQSWGMNLTRIVRRKEEQSQWSFRRLNEAGGPAFFGELAGLRIRARPQRVELLPYVVARNERLSSGNPESPFYDSNAGAMRVGGDLKYLLTSNLTLSATVNPDFGQVEVDPAVVNLSAFETFFPERRPFFVEGGGLFDYGTAGCYINCGHGLNLFYSRRVGRGPQGGGLALARGPYVDLPENSAILGAVKLTGRTSGGYTVGVLNAVTRAEVARVSTAGGDRLEQPVEPLTNSLVGRVRREMMDGQLVLGAIGTSVNRDLSDDGLAGLLPRSAQSAGVDVNYSWGARTYQLYAALAGSRVAGDTGAIRLLQQSSARYLHRPDRGGGSNGLFSGAYDPAARALTGYGAIARVAKSAGNWIGDLNAAAISPGFETNDMGFQQVADWRWVNGAFGRQFTRPTAYFRTMTVMAGTSQAWNYDGDLTDRDVTGMVNIELPNYWNGFLGMRRTFPTLSDRLARGGPVVGRPGGMGVSASLATNTRRRVSLRGELNMSSDQDGGGQLSGVLDATLRPAPNVLLTVGPAFSRSTSTNQYVGSVADSTSRAFFGRRYLFAHLRQQQVYMNVRANVTFTPDLSLELFAQPFLASGDYDSFLEFAAPRERDKRVYGRDVGTVEEQVASDGRISYRVDPDAEGPAASFTLANPDFNFRSLRGTGVLRWEWRPGSTAFLAWTQRRSARAPVGDFDFARDGAALFDAPADNVFVLKISYWLGM